MIEFKFLVEFPKDWSAGDLTDRCSDELRSSLHPGMDDDIGSENWRRGMALCKAYDETLCRLSAGMLKETSDTRFWEIEVVFDTGSEVGNDMAQRWLEWSPREVAPDEKYKEHVIRANEISMIFVKGAAASSGLAKAMDERELLSGENTEPTTKSLRRI